MFERVAKVEFPTLGYWPGVFSKVAENPYNEFRGPFSNLGRLGTGGAYCFGDPVTLGRRRLAGYGASCTGDPATLGGGGCWGDPATLGRLGAFESGFDLAGWGVTEWAIAAGAVYALFAVFSTTKRGVRRVRKYQAGRAARAKRRRSLQRQLQEA